MLSSHLEIHEIRVFKTVCDTGGFKSAADRLHVTQSAVSQTIASLERKLSTRLIERGKPIALTESGTRLQVYAARVLQEEHSVLADIADIRQGVASTLQIAMSGSVSQLYGNELLEDYCDSNPLTRLKVDVMPSRKIIQGVLADSLELGFGPFQQQMPALLETVPLFQESRKLVISRLHPRLARLLQDPEDTIREIPLMVSHLEDPDVRHHLGDQQPVTALEHGGQEHWHVLRGPACVAGQRGLRRFRATAGVGLLPHRPDLRAVFPQAATAFHRCPPVHRHLQFFLFRHAAGQEALTMTALQLYAGPTALASIQRDGLSPEQFRTIVGASGGPKWFVLYGLDRYLAGEFFAGRRQPLETIGSSAGAWRLSCLGLADPLAGIDRLAWHYSRERYSARPTTQEITAAAARLVTLVLGPEGAAQIAGNPVVRVHIVADRARTLVSSDRKLLLGAGLGLSALGNALSRRLLGQFFQRVVFHAGPVSQAVQQWREFNTVCVPLRPDNVAAALLASGAIPIIIDGVRDIPGAPPGVYRDGGITDYHFDAPLRQGDGLVLYPHFYSRFTPGWFDKSLPWRSADPANFDNVLVLAPSPAFVAGLPYGKIPDRKDFETLDDATRFACWQTVLSESARLADEFSTMVRTGQGLERILPLAAAPH